MAFRTWDFTVNNYSTKDIDFFQNLEVKKIKVSKEVGDTGTPHLQGRVTLLRTYRLSALKKLHPTAHWEPTKAGQDFNYIMKLDSEIIISKGVEDTQGSRTDIKSSLELLKEDGLSAFKDATPEIYIKFHVGIEKLYSHYQKNRDFKPHVIWIHGPTDTGKTRFVMDNFTDVWMSGRDLKFWDGYQNQEVVVLDDFRGSFCTYHELLRILDRYPYTVNVKHGSVKLNSLWMFVTSPKPPDEVYETREDIQQLLRRIDVTINTAELLSMHRLNGWVQEQKTKINQGQAQTQVHEGPEISGSS